MMMNNVLYFGYTKQDGQTSKYTISPEQLFENTLDNGYNYPCSCCGMTYQRGNSVKTIRGVKRGIRLLLDKPDIKDKTTILEHSKNIYKQVKTRNGTHLVIVKVANG
jgi:hypothetical protein